MFLAGFTYKIYLKTHLELVYIFISCLPQYALQLLPKILCLELFITFLSCLFIRRGIRILFPSTGAITPFPPIYIANLCCSLINHSCKSHIGPRPNKSKSLLLIRCKSFSKLIAQSQNGYNPVYWQRSVYLFFYSSRGSKRCCSLFLSAMICSTFGKQKYVYNYIP